MVARRRVPASMLRWYAPRSEHDETGKHEDAGGDERVAKIAPEERDKGGEPEDRRHHKRTETKRTGGFGTHQSLLKER